MAKLIPLTQGKLAIVDDEDYEYLSQFKWYAEKHRKTFYASRSVYNPKRTVRMHVEIMGYREGYEVDHIDGDGLNNIKSNLRHVTTRQNQQNRRNIRKTSSYPGVCYDKDSNRWRSTICVNNRNRFLGNYDTEREAFSAYLKSLSEIGESVVQNRY